MKKIWTADEILSAGRVERRGFLKGSAVMAGLAMAGPFTGSFARAADDKRLQIMAWAGSELNVELGDWRKKNGVTVEVASMGSQDDVTAKFNVSSPPPFDAAEYNHAYADLYIDIVKILKPLDRAKIPNYNNDNIIPEFYEKPTWYRDGVLYGVPFAWGINTVVYNPKMMAEPKSYKDLLAPELKGKIVIADDTLASWPVAAMLAGHGDRFPNLTKQQMAEVFEVMKQYRAQAKVVALTYGDVVSLFNSGEVAALFSGWTGIPNETMKQGVETRYTIPSEGAGTWCDSWFIPLSSDNVDLAHEFLNMAISPEVQAQVAKNIVAAVVNPKAVPLLDPATKAMFNYDDLGSVFKSAPLLGIPPLESDEYATYQDWQAEWNALKAS